MWEGVGVCSYLLVHFWYTRVGAVKSAMSAMFTNRVGDFFLTIGFFVIFFTFGTLDYATVFSLAPYINTNIITFISILLLLGAAAKSAQLGLHIWLPAAMEGKRINKRWNKFLGQNNLYIYCTKRYVKKVAFLNQMPKYAKDGLIGDLLGGGHIRYTEKKELTNNKFIELNDAKMEFTFTVTSIPFYRFLKFAYPGFFTDAEPTTSIAVVNGKPIVHYLVSTRALSIFTKLHKDWYRKVDNKSIKIIPLNIGELLKAQGLAHLIMWDGHWIDKTVHIYTDSFTKQEVELLTNVINTNFGIKAEVKEHIKYPEENNADLTKYNISWRIKIKETSLPRLKELVLPFMITETVFKLGIDTKSHRKNIK
jgi:LAGLIDADG DNA endonuclease family/Proton-conducting membrane transporter